MSARNDILKRIRAANQRPAEPIGAEREVVLERLRMHLRGPLPTVSGELVPRFRERCIAMLSTIDEIDALTEAPHAVARYLREQGLPHAGVCWPALSDLDWQRAGLAIEGRAAQGNDMVGITGAYCGIAETGTLMQLSGDNEPAATSLLPETHIALLPWERIVRTMEDAWDLLRRERDALPRQVNFISGPSRTADIEMTLVMGAHGPFRVHIILTGSRSITG
jgi:L-lactate dehydrogenase complex protein LldG